jgi:pimeloyl-ACP methyl ester carboxylesterase
MGLLALSSACVLGLAAGCAVMRNHTSQLMLRPCSDGYAVTRDGWMLGIRHFHPESPDPGKLPVVLCHGLGLNGTFWTLTDDNMPTQLAARGYEVFVVDMRGSGASRKIGSVGRVNRVIRHTPMLEIGQHDWTVDHESFFDVPAILDYVERKTGSHRVNWVGHSLGGMLLFPYLEFGEEPDRIANFVAMGSPIIMAPAPQIPMIRANRGLRNLLSIMSTSRTARFLTWGRPPGLDKVDRFYYSAENVDTVTIDRFYGYTLEDPGPGALEQLEHYLDKGRMVSADRQTDYVAHLGEVRNPILFVAGEGDVLAPMAAVVATYEATGSADKSLARFGIREGFRADYGHCDLVWSRFAPEDIFPAVADWLEPRQPGRALPTPQTSSRPRHILAPTPPVATSAPAPGGVQEAVQTDLRPGLELLPKPPNLVEIPEGPVR